MMMLTFTNIGGTLVPADEATKNHIMSSPPKVVLETDSMPKNIGNVGLDRLWRTWMRETATFMSSAGVTRPAYVDATGVAHDARPFTEDDAHDLFTMKWLGSTANGKRLSWSRTHKSGYQVASREERIHAMEAHEAWAADRGIQLTIPVKSEYRELLSEYA